MIQNMDHINIVASDLAKSIDFFTQFGFKISVEPSPLSGDWISNIVGLESVQANYAVLTMTNSTTNIELTQYDWPPSQRDPNITKANQIGFRHLAFRVSDIEMLVQKLQDKGIAFLSPIQTYHKTGKKLVYLQGPDQILLELAQYV